MGADSFRLSTAMGVDGQLTTSTAALLMSEASWSIKEGGMFARQLSKCSAMPVCGVLWTVAAAPVLGQLSSSHSLCFFLCNFMCTVFY